MYSADRSANGADYQCANEHASSNVNTSSVSTTINDTDWTIADNSTQRMSGTIESYEYKNYLSKL